MPRLLKVLFFAIAIVGLAVFAISCGSSGAQARFVITIPDSPINFDINLNSSSTALFTDIGFEAVEPSTGYQKVSSGSVKLELYQTGTTTQVLASTLNLGGSTQYTWLATGFYSAPSGVLITDNNTAPSSGNVEFRIIHASPSGPGNVDVYMVPPGTNIGAVSPNVSGLAYTQASSYVSLTAGTYAVIVTPAGNKTPFINQDYTLTAGQIRTLVVIDISGGGAPSQIPLELSDLG